MDYMDIKPFLDGWNKGFDSGIDFIKTQLQSEDFANIIKNNTQEITGELISQWLDGRENREANIREMANNGA